MLSPSTGLEIVTHSSMNNNIYLIGTTETAISFPVLINPINHTIIYLAKYMQGGSRYRILGTTKDDALIGFWNGNSGTAYENGWITNDDIDRGNQWLISSQQPGLYRGNMVDYTISTSPGLLHSTNILAINAGWSVSFQPNAPELSDFSFAELIVFNEILDIENIHCIEYHLQSKYTLPTPSPTSFPTTNEPTSPTQSPTPHTIITARFKLIQLPKNFTMAEAYCQQHYGTHSATF